MDIRILSGGAAGGLVKTLTPAFRQARGIGISGEFGAVGGMRDRVMAGEPVDVVILTRALVEQLADDGHVDPATIRDLGAVETGICVPERNEPIDASTPEALAAALLQADAIYLSDPEKATAGRHFMRVLAELGVADRVADRLRPHPSGHIGMAAMAAGDDRRPVGCTQATEILTTPGVRYCGALPAPYGLVTTYTAGLSTRAADADAASALVDLLTGAEGAEARRKAGFGA